MSLRKILLKLAVYISLWSLTTFLIFSAQTAAFWRNFPKEKVLDNGLTLIYQQDKSSAITVLHILINGGKKVEKIEKRGLAYLTTRLTLEIPDQRKVQDLMNLASHVSMICKGDYSLINIACLSDNLEETLKIVTKIMLKPLFSGMRINRIKEQMIHQQNTEDDNPINVAHNTQIEILFGETGYGGSVLGSEESLKAIKKKEIENFYNNYFKADNMIVAVSSDIKERSLIDILKKYFERFPLGKPPESKPESRTIPEEKIRFIDKETKQSLVSFAFPLPKITARNFALASIVENLLGKGVGSRLWPLRAEEKLAYNVNSKATQWKEGGILEAYLETDNTKKEVAVEALKEVLHRLFEEGISEEELETTKIYSKGVFLRNNETKETRTHNFCAFEALGLGYKFIDKFFMEIDAVSLEEINAYIKDILNPEKGVQVIVGPSKTEVSKK